MTPASLSIFASRLDAVCEEMGLVLRNAAFSPNIRDRLDFSCAVFDASGQLCAQAAHIPVHLGSMAFAMRDIVAGREWQPGDQVMLNDPYLGGTHLPDVTLIAPIFADGRLQAFVVNRAHHADIGAASPGSMPISSHLDEEGLVIEPTLLVRGNVIDAEQLRRVTAATRNSAEAGGDFAAQVAAKTPGLYPVLITSFKCSPDAFIQDYFKKLMDTHDKPYLVLELDEHDSSVGYETRIEAAVRAFGNHHQASAPAHVPDVPR